MNFQNIQILMWIKAAMMYKINYECKRQSDLNNTSSSSIKTKKNKSTKAQTILTTILERPVSSVLPVFCMLIVGEARNKLKFADGKVIKNEVDMQVYNHCKHVIMVSYTPDGFYDYCVTMKPGQTWWYKCILLGMYLNSLEQQ